MVITSLGTRGNCKLVFYLLWQMHLASLPFRQIPANLTPDGPLTTVHLKWDGSNTMTREEPPMGAALRHFHKQPIGLLRMYHMFHCSDWSIQLCPEAFWC